MKTFRKYTWIVSLFVASLGCAQITPEQKKMIEEAEKQADKAQKMHDSIMNFSQMKKVMAQMEAMDGQYAKEKTKTKKTTAKEIVKQTSHLDRYIISEGNAAKFENWPHGSATIVLVTQPYKRQNKQEKVVGAFQEDGKFSLQSFEEVAFDRKLSDFFRCEGTDAASTIYTAPETGIIPAYLSVRKDGEEIGALHLASSRQQVYNNSPVGKYRGDPGYLIELFYVEGSATARATCTRNIEGTDHAEITKQIEITNSYDLSFEPGWNYVKVAIDGSQNVGKIPFYKTKRYTVVGQKPADVRWVFSKY